LIERYSNETSGAIGGRTAIQVADREEYTFNDVVIYSESEFFSGLATHCHRQNSLCGWPVRP